MKKYLVTTFLLLGTVSFAQNISKNALGLRIPLNYNNFGINYQRAFSNDTRLELELGIRNQNNIDAYKATVVYQWLGKLDNSFNWYGGVGGALGTWNYDSNNYSNSGSIVAITGQIGVEYYFNIPLQAFIDLRPNIHLTNYKKNNFEPEFGIGMRYKF